MQKETKIYENQYINDVHDRKYNNSSNNSLTYDIEVNSSADLRVRVHLALVHAGVSQRGELDVQRPVVGVLRMKNLAGKKVREDKRI